jgi:hypothetical protein
MTLEVGGRVESNWWVIGLRARCSGSGQRRFLADLFADEGVSKDARGVDLPNGNRDRRYMRGQNQMMRRVSRENPANRKAGIIMAQEGRCL